MNLRFFEAFFLLQLAEHYLGSVSVACPDHFLSPVLILLNTLTGGQKKKQKHRYVYFLLC